MEEQEVVEIATKLADELNKNIPASCRMFPFQLVQAAATIQLTKAIKQAFMLGIPNTIPVLETMAMVLESK